MKQLSYFLEQGKRRGYEEVKMIDGVAYFIQYAIKKENGVYATYCFSIEESKMDTIEDYGNEEFEQFCELSDAIDYFNSKGCDISKFNRIKGTLPF